MKWPMKIELYSGYEGMRKALNHLDATYTEENFYSGFYGIRFVIDKFTGKGKLKKNRLLMELNGCSNWNQAIKNILAH